MQAPINSVSILVHLALSALIIALPVSTLAQAPLVCGDAFTRDTLLAMKKRDQEVRRAHAQGIKEKGWGMEHPEMRELIRTMSEVDTKNQEFLDEIIARCGWPTQDAVGYEAELAAILVALHAESREKYFPHIHEGFRSKRIHGEWYARFVDTMLMSEGKPQRYGTRIHMLTKEVWQLENPSQLNTRRESVGLDTLPEFPPSTLESK